MTCRAREAVTMANTIKDEPKTGPQPDRWYNLTLGSSFKEDSSNKFCTLRYEFKPASIDKSKSGSLHKKKDNRVSVEFQNNQVGKPKVTFEGSSEDYKENDAVLFFDGKCFRLERLHRAVKQLRHVRLPGESAAASVAPSSGPTPESRLSPVFKPAKPTLLSKPTLPPIGVEVERIDVGAPENPGTRLPGNKRPYEDSSDNLYSSIVSRDHKNYETEEHQDIVIEDLFGSETPEKENSPEQGVNGGSDMNMPQHNDTDDEIADVDDSGDEANNGPNAAEALRAQVGSGEGKNEATSSSSGSSGSSSSGSGSSSASSSSSSDSDGSDEDSVNSI